MIATPIPPTAANNGQGEAPSLAEFAQVEFAPSLEPDDEEEERHQAAVDPVAKVERDLCGRRGRWKLRAPERVGRAGVDVDPGERSDGRGKEDCGAPGLRAQEFAKRRLQIPGPRRSARERGRTPACALDGAQRALSPARRACTSCTAIDPSPTAAAQRLIEPERTSPAAKTPGTLVSSR